MRRVRQVQARTRFGKRAQGGVDRLWLGRAVHRLREFRPMRLHNSEIDLSRHARARLPTQKERNLAKRVPEIERTFETRCAGELSVIGCPVRQGDSELF